MTPIDFDLLWGMPSGDVPDYWSADPFVSYYFPTGYGAGALDPPFFDMPSSGQIAGWVDEALDQGVTLAGQKLSQLVGMKPRGDFSKFLREVYTYVKTRAAVSGLAVDVYWFDDIVRVNPDGKWGVTYKGANSLASAVLYWQQLAKADHFEVLSCPHGSEDIPSGQCVFTPYGAGLSLLQKAGAPAGVLSTAGLGWGAMALVAWLLWKKGGLFK